MKALSIQQPHSDSPGLWAPSIESRAATLCSSTPTTAVASTMSLTTAR